jgi:aminoglycoside 6'-N-acetyltransferase I
MKILEASESQFEAWLGLRKLLWPEAESMHAGEMRAILASDTQTAFLIFNSDDQAVGFIEGAIYLNPPQDYGYVEGWYVLPAFRGQGLGGELLGTLEQWFLHNTISLSLSDTLPAEYPLSPKAHVRYGYREYATMKIFIKQLKSDRDVSEHAPHGPSDVEAGYP